MSVTGVERDTVRYIDTVQDLATTSWTPLQNLAKQVAVKLEGVFSLENYSVGHLDDEKMGAAAGKISEFWELARRIGNHKPEAGESQELKESLNRGREQWQAIGGIRELSY